MKRMDYFSGRNDDVFFNRRQYNWDSTRSNTTNKKGGIKTMKRKFLSTLLALCIMCSLLTVNASAQVLSGKHGTDFATGALAERLETIFYNGISGCVSPSIPAVGGSMGMNQSYTTTFANQRGSKTDSTCQAYARAAYSYLFGYDMAEGSYRNEFLDAKARNELNYSLFAQYGVRCGAYLRTTNLSDGSYSKDNVVIGHSMIILGYDSVGITILEGNYDNNGRIGICYFTWSQFNQNRMNKRYVCSLSQPMEGIYAALGCEFISTSSPYFSCNVRINCVNGQTVNLYSYPGDASRAAYFDLGQTVNSTCGMARNDGATWYQITANHNGTPKTFWLKYESGKMTVTNLMSKGPYTMIPKCAPRTRLDVSGASAEDGANVQIYTSNSTAAQQWELTYLNNGYYKITSKASGKVLDVAGASTEAGANVQQYTSNGTNAQQWMLKDAGNGYYYIVPKVNTGLCLDVAGAGSADGTNVGIYTSNGTDAQK